MIRSARHRVGQFVGAMSARLRPPESGAATAVLPPELFTLFLRMPPEDRRHGLDALHRLKAEGRSEPLLLQAALLHDVGKAESGILVLHRIARVLLAKRARPLWRGLSGAPTGWRRPFWVLAHHAERGAVWVESLGAPPELVALILYHEEELPPAWRETALADWHGALAAVDARC